MKCIYLIYFLFKYTHSQTQTASINKCIRSNIFINEEERTVMFVCTEHKLLIIMTYQHKVESFVAKLSKKNLFCGELFEVREKIDAVNKYFFSFDLFNGMVHFNIYSEEKLAEHLSKVTFVNGIII